MGRPPRLLIVSTIEAFVRAFLLPHAEHFHRRGWRVDVLARGASANGVVRSAFDHAWDIGWSRNPAAPRNLLLEPRRVRSLVAANGYDIVHVHTPVASFVTRWALRSSRPNGCKVVYTAHGFHFYRGGGALANLAYRSAEQLAARWTDELIVINSEDYRAALHFGSIDPRRVHLVPGIGVDIAAYAAPPPPELRASLRASIGVPADAFVILMVAEFNPGKRHADLLRAFARLEGDRAHLVLAGRGPLEAATLELARELGVAGRVHLLGYRDDVPELLHAADLYALPSEREGLPRTVLEAMSASTPVIASDIRGVRDLLQDGVGMLVPAGDVEALAAGLADAVARPEALASMAGRASQRVQAYDQSLVLAEHEALYARVLGRLPAHRAVPAAGVP